MLALFLSENVYSQTANLNCILYTQITHVTYRFWFPTTSPFPSVLFSISDNTSDYCTTTVYNPKIKNVPKVCQASVRLHNNVRQHELFFADSDNYTFHIHSVSSMCVCSIVLHIIKKSKCIVGLPVANEVPTSSFHFVIYFIRPTHTGGSLHAVLWQQQLVSVPAAARHPLRPTARHVRSCPNAARRRNQSPIESS